MRLFVDAVAAFLVVAIWAYWLMGNADKGYSWQEGIATTSFVLAAAAVVWQLGILLRGTEVEHRGSPT